MLDGQLGIPAHMIWQEEKAAALIGRMMAIFHDKQLPDLSPAVNSAR